MRHKNKRNSLLQSPIVAIFALAFLVWLCTVAWGQMRTLPPPNEADFSAQDLLTLKGWENPITISAIKSRTLTLGFTHNAMFFVNAQTGYAVGDGGTILFTDNAGKTWQAQTSGTGNNLLSVHFTGAQTGYAVGDGGTILFTDNAGKTWQAQTSGTGNNLLSVHFTGAQTGYAVGDGGTIIFTNNAGKTWQAQTSGTGNTLLSVHFTGAQTGYAVGYDGTILFTNNAGKTWQAYNSFYKTMVAYGERLKNELPPYQRYPSPWLLLLLLGLVWYLTLCVYGWVNSDGAKTAGGIAGGIGDAAIKRMNADRLGRAGIARTLAYLMRNPATLSPLAIAVNAPWGEGKSSILGMLKDELHGHANCVWINPWHYREEGQLLAAFIEHIRDQALPPKLSIANLFFRWQLFYLRLIAPNGRGLLFMLIFLAVWFWFFPSESVDVIKSLVLAEAGFSQSTIIQWPSLLLKLFNSGAVLNTWVSFVVNGLGSILVWGFVIRALWRGMRQTLSSFSPEVLQAIQSATTATSKALAVPNWAGDTGLRYRFAHDFKLLCMALGRGKLVLLIDDLDRCPPKQVEATMSTLNFIFSNPESPCFAVLAMDKNIVCASLGIAYKDIAKAVHSSKPNLETAEENQTLPEKDAHQIQSEFAHAFVEKIVQLEVFLEKSDGAMLIQSPKKTKSSAWKKIRQGVGIRVTKVFSYLSIKGVVAQCRRLLGSVWGSGSGLKLGIKSVTSVSKALMGALLVIPKVGFYMIRSIRWIHIKYLGNIALILLASSILAILSISAINAGAKWYQETPENSAPPETLEESPIVLPSSAPSVVNGESAPLEKKSASGTNSGGVVIPAHTSTSHQINALSLFMLWSAFTVLVLAVRDQGKITDSEGFIKAVKVWQPILQEVLSTPRDWLRLQNTARLLALRFRAESYCPWHEKIWTWWVEGGKQNNAPDDNKEEALAAELFLLDVFSGGDCYEKIKKWSEGDGGKILIEHLNSYEFPFGGFESYFCEVATNIKDEETSTKILEMNKNEFFAQCLVENSILPAFFDGLAKETSPEGIHTKKLKKWLVLYSSIGGFSKKVI